MSNNSITLSPKHGVNPSLLTCFWCGKEIGIAMMGKLKDDAAAPRHVYDGYNPCEECQGHMDGGITIVSVSETPLAPGQTSIHPKHNLYPTGDWIVIKEEALDNLDLPYELKDATLKERKLLVDHTIFKKWTEEL